MLELAGVLLAGGTIGAWAAQQYWQRRMRGCQADQEAVHEGLRRENFTLRDALREANQELRSHRLLIAGLRRGDADVTSAMQRIFAKGEQ